MFSVVIYIVNIIMIMIMIICNHSYNDISKSRFVSFLLVFVTVL